MCTTIVLGTRSLKTRPITNAFGRLLPFKHCEMWLYERLLSRKGDISRGARRGLTNRCTQNPCDAACIVFIGFVAHRRECAFDLACFHTHDLKACRLQAVGQILSERACFQSNTFDLNAQIVQLGDNVLNIRGKLSF